MDITFHLEKFDGPLDLLLNLISKNKVSILDIPISKILEQYLEYLEKMREFDMTVASDFVAMAAQLTYIKSKMLLPVYENEEEQDPRAELVSALLEYQKIKEIGETLSEMEELGRDVFVKYPEKLEKNKEFNGQIKINALVRAVNNILEREERNRPLETRKFTGIAGKKVASVNEKIADIIELFKIKDKIELEEIMRSAQSRSDVVAIFLAVLELIKANKVDISEQTDGYSLSLCSLDNTIPRYEEEENGK